MNIPLTFQYLADSHAEAQVHGREGRSSTGGEEG